MCAVVVLNENYSGENIDSTYCQDVKTGLPVEKTLDIPLRSILDQPAENHNFELLINSFFKRIDEKNLLLRQKEIIEAIKKEVFDEIKAGKITEDQFGDEVWSRIKIPIGNLLAFEFPYTIEDMDDGEYGDMLDMIHSNIREDRYEDLCEYYKTLIGKNYRFNNGDMWSVVSFEKGPRFKRNSIAVVQILVKMKDVDSNKFHYVKFAHLLDWLKAAGIIKVKEPSA